MPAKSQAQQRFMGMVHAEKEGTLDKSKLDPAFAAKIERIAKRIKAKAAEDLAETKHKNLPEKVKTASPPEGNSQGQKIAQTYKIVERKKSVGERLTGGILGGGVPSALLTAGINIGSLKKNPKGVLSSAATAGAFGSALGTLFSSKKKRTLVPVNDK